MATFYLSAANGLCRMARRRALKPVITEAEEYAALLGSDTKVLDEHLRVVATCDRRGERHGAALRRIRTRSLIGYP